MSSITRKLDKVNNIPIDAFPCVITLRYEIISNISDNFTEQSVYEHKPYVDASVIGERDAWAAIVTTRNGKELCRDQGLMISQNLSSYREELQGCKGALLLVNKFNKDMSRVLLCDNL
jgi:hypothetical protein